VIIKSSFFQTAIFFLKYLITKVKKIMKNILFFFQHFICPQVHPIQNKLQTPSRINFKLLQETTNNKEATKLIKSAQQQKRQHLTKR
jgi:hypothetical protein